MQKHVKKIVDKIACETKTSRNESICIFCLKVSFESCFSWHLFQQFQGYSPPSTGLAEARHKQRSRQKNSVAQRKQTEQMIVGDKPRAAIQRLPQPAQQAPVFFKTKEELRLENTRGEKRRGKKKVNRRLLRRLRLPQKKTTTTNQTNKQTTTTNAAKSLSLNEN